MDYSKPLVFKSDEIKWYQNPRLLRYVFSTLLIATLVSIFELGFVYFVSLPETERSVNAQFPPVPNDPPIFKQIEKVEKGNREKKNKYLVLNYASVILVLFFLIAYVYSKMKEDQKRVPVFGHNFRATILQSVFSVLLLILFQIFFFGFAQKAPLLSKEEIDYHVAKNTLERTKVELSKR